MSCQNVVSYDHVTTGRVVSYSSVTTTRVLSYDLVTTNRVVSYDPVTTTRVVSYNLVTTLTDDSELLPCFFGGIRYQAFFKRRYFYDIYWYFATNI